ncbi:MAG: phage holin family protein [Fimbriimonadaceae bacterium]
MIGLLIRWLVFCVTLVLAAWLTSLLGFDFTVNVRDGIQGWIGIALGVALLAIINATIGNLLKLLTLPIACLTFGLSTLIINALMFWWVGSWGIGFQVGGFLPALVGSIIWAILNMIALGVLPKGKED